jgi:hypothetical protein
MFQPPFQRARLLGPILLWAAGCMVGTREVRQATPQEADPSPGFLGPFVRHEVI